VSRTSRALGLVGAIFVAAVALAGPAAPATAAADGPTLEAHALLQGHGRLGAWLAIDVRLANEGTPVAGELQLQGGSQGGTRFSVPVDLPSPSDKRFTLYAQPPSFGREIEVVFVVDDEPVARQKVAFTVHETSQLVIGVVAAQPAGIASGIQLPAVQNSANPVQVPLTVADLPAKVEAWSSMDRLIWQDVDSNLLTADQLAALRGWLALGGRLIVVGGTAGPGVLSGFPDEILPYRPTTTVDVAAGSLASLLAEVPDDATDVPAMGGELIDGRALVTSGDHVVAADRSYGSGSVTVIGLDPTSGWIAESKATQALWRNLIPARGSGFVGMGDDREIVGAVSELPALALPPIGGLILLLFGYIALIGPINYLVLKRIDRREWAWVTMPALIAVFAAGAYAYGSALRGSDMIVNEVAIVRGAPGATEGSAQVYLGVFSPTRGTYQLALPGGALVSAPVQGDFFGGQGTVLDVVQGEPARVRNLAVGFGSLRTIRAEAPAEVPLVQAELELRDGFVTGTVRNESNKTLEAPAVVLGASAVVLQDILPGQTADVRLRVDSGQIGAMLSDKIVGQVFVGDPAASNERQRRAQARYRVISQLTSDPTFGNLSQLASDVPVLMAWGRDPVVDVEIAGQQPARAANVLYYIPVPMQIRGQTSFGWDLMRNTVLAADAAFFTRDPYSMNFGQGTVTVAYRPIPFEGTMTPSKVLMSYGFGERIDFGGQPIEPMPPIDPPIVCITDPCLPAVEPAPQIDPNVGFDGLPETEVLNRLTGEWRRLPHLTTGETYELKNPTSYVDPSTGTIQVRFVNDNQNSVNVTFNVVIQGEVR